MRDSYTVSAGWLDRSFAVDVEFYADKVSMNAIASEEHGPFDGEMADGFCHCFEDDEDPVALIRLADDGLTLEAVAHESAHAAVHIAGKMIDSLPDGADEMIPLLTGRLTSAIWSVRKQSKKGKR